MFLFGLLGIIIHAIFLYSVFDIYFKSPLIHGMTPFSTPIAPPAKRLVLLVADGLRADKFFEVDNSGQTTTPYLRDIIFNTGTWGISHTRVPTESRPGHVALIGGIYEDVSAVTKGWKENPVEFDSVFNESRYTWSWGSPDILPMFSKGSKQNVFIDTYTSAEEDFAGAKPHDLDTWVFEKVEKFFESARKNSTLKSMLSQGNLIFFLHLLGMDISGHSYKPGSQEYTKNLEVLDSGIEKCVNLINSFYGHDDKTSFIFTADHGMTDWGSHGSGEMHETYTPLVAWGAGIRAPLGEGKDIYHDGLSTDWHLDQVKRVDINQVDIPPLIATLIGIPFPVNSLGILPVEYLSTPWNHKALSLLTNARQILANYQCQMRRKKENTFPLFFWEFKELSSSRQAELMSIVDTLLKQDRYKDVIQVGLKIIELALKGMSYYQKHDRLALSVSVFLGFVGWIAYVFVLILKDYTTFGHTSLEAAIDPPDESFFKAKCIVSYMLIGSMISLLLYAQNAPVMYYAYFLLPVLMWMLITLHWNLIKASRVSVWHILLGFIAMELLVASFFKREVLSVVLWLLAAWPFVSPLKDTHKRLCFAWAITSVVLSVFPMMTVVGKTASYNLVILAGWLFVLAVGYCARRPETGLILNNRIARREPYQIVILTAVQVIILCVSTYTVQSTSHHIANKDGLPLVNQIVSWCVLGVSMLFPLFGSQSVLTRLLNVLTSLFAPYILLSVSHEGLFCLLLCVQMMLWLVLEHQLSSNYANLQDISFVVNSDDPTKRRTKDLICFGDFRRAYFFKFFILLAFFGTGNIASINSFNPTSVYCFITVFNPFIMGFLLLIKVMIPFLIVSCSLRAINVCIRVSPRALFLLVLSMSDFMALHFFFLVRDSGSWLDIGTSIGHFVISITIIIFIMILYGLAWIFTSFNLTVPPLKTKRT